MSAMKPTTAIRTLATMTTTMVSKRAAAAATLSASRTSSSLVVPPLQRQQQQKSLHQLRALSTGTSSRLLFPYKDDQDRESLKPRYQENSQSAISDDAVAAQNPDAAFNPDKTSPEEELATATGEEGKGKNGDDKNQSTLGASPANREFASWDSGTAAEEARRKEGSKKGSSTK